MVWLPDVEKFEDMFICFDRIHKRDRQTDGQINRQTPHDGIGHAYAYGSIERQKSLSSN